LAGPTEPHGRFHIWGGETAAGTLGHNISNEDLRRGIAVVEDIRRETGDKMAIAIEGHARWDLPTATRIARVWSLTTSCGSKKSCRRTTSRRMPKPSDRWTKYAEKYPGCVAAYREIAVRCAILGTGVGSKEWSKFGREGVRIRGWLTHRPVRERDLTSAAWVAPREWRNPAGTVCGIGALLFVAGVALMSFLALPLLVVRFVLRLRNRGGSVEAGHSLPRRLLERVRMPAIAGPTAVLLVVLTVLGVFIVLLWEGHDRFFYPFVPLIAVMSCTAAGVVLDLPVLWVGGWWLRGWRMVLVTALACAALYTGLVRGKEWKTRYEATTDMTKYPYTDVREIPRMGEFIREHLPTSTIMTRYPWQLQFYLGESNKTVNVPLAPPETIFAIARYYGVTHYIYDCRRPGMESYVSRPHPGFVPVTNAPGALFEMKLDLLPGGTAGFAGECPLSF
jgi:hypothetical protein